MEVENFLDLYRQGQRNFAEVDLRGIGLIGANIKDIDLTGANLTGANLSWASLSNAKLTGACLEGADLRSAILTGANLDRVNLNRAKLQNVDLRLATLQEAELSWTAMQAGDFSGADFQKAKLSQSNLERAKLDRAQLIGAQLNQANFYHASLIGANLSSTNLREACLEAASLRDAILIDANLTEANLSNTYLRGANLSQADLHRAILVGADLTEANLQSADLSRANLVGAYLLKVSLKKAYLVRSLLQEVYLLQADLSEANLHGADLRRADLSGAYLLDTILSQADLRDAFLIQSHLIRTNFHQTQMTGCCIHNWQLEDVDLSSVDCSYVFTKFDRATKRCSDRFPIEGDFQPGELAKAYKQDVLAPHSSAIELFFQEPPNWEALVLTLAKLELDNQNLRLTIHAYAQVQSKYLLVLTANGFINTKNLAQRVLQLYPGMFELIQSKREAILALLPFNNSIKHTIEQFKQPASGQPHKIESVTIPLLHNRQQQIYQHIVNQIKKVINFPSPEQSIFGLKQLLEFTERHNIPTEKICKEILAPAIINRAKKDHKFYQYLVNWQQTETEPKQFSKLANAVDLAIGNLH